MDWKHQKGHLCPLWAAKAPVGYWIIGSTERGETPFLLFRFDREDKPWEQKDMGEYRTLDEAKAAAGRMEAAA